MARDSVCYRLDPVRPFAANHPMNPAPRIAITLLVALLAGTGRAYGQDPGSATLRVHDIPRVSGDIAIDGALDEAAWAQAKAIDIAYEISPGDNIPAPVRTTVRIGHTDDALYVSFHAEDSDPARIRAYLRVRDAAFNDDWIGMFMDTFDDQRRAYEFFVNPPGVQMDLIKEETTGGNEDSSWDGLWTSARPNCWPASRGTRPQWAWPMTVLPARRCVRPTATTTATGRSTAGARASIPAFAPISVSSACLATASR